MKDNVRDKAKLKPVTRVSEAGVLAYRVTGIVVGGYLLWSGLLPISSLGLHRAGMSLPDAALIATSLGVLFYIGLLIWGFAAPLRCRPATLLLVAGLIAMVTATLLIPGEGVV
ncbi:MAG: hypothetical protein AAGF53_16505 [Pseudomonadota bacterium]